ncbi:MAG: HAMP domain-containing protein [Planctomycetes bacterium]|nr:HAMP domain-containing protein [Planctomycetota bacterium]
MAKRLVIITLAAKCRILFGAATILIIGAALVVPWMYIEALANERILRAGEEITRLYLNEWTAKHGQKDQPIKDVVQLFLADDSSAVRWGPKFITPKGIEVLDPSDERYAYARQALKSFRRNPGNVFVRESHPDQGRGIHHIYRPVLVGPSCRQPACHDASVDPPLQFKLNDLAGVIVADLPDEQAGGSLMIGRVVIITAGVLAFLLATLTFYFITQRLILSPVRKLKGVADKVAEGDMSVRSGIKTGDEFEQLGHSFDEMLQAITKTQDQLRTANRALDLKLNELAESNLALFEANRLKSEFLTNVSHELRTPLNSIIGFADLLEEMGDDRVKRYAGNILTPARMLLRIINDLLDLARIEAGKVKLTVTQVSIADVCETLVSLVTPQAQKKNLNLTLSLGENLPIIETDAGKVQQILYNLLSNAIKFTPAGGDVSLSANINQRDHTIAVCVADTGPGISEANQAHIFEQFYQADPSVTREHGGAGLGLTIAKDLAGLLGGRLTLQSESGKGAAFTLLLPHQLPEKQNLTVENP